jgi:2-polyprenyl-3-methyl-5-hydroxy-6-metoxy-1,4-benzoquinol methylase
MATKATTKIEIDHAHQQAVEAFQDKMLQASSGVFEMFSIYIGDKLGLYCALNANSPMTSTELSLVTKTQERYIREWLEQQVVAGILYVVEEAEGPFDRRYGLSTAHAEVLADKESLNYLAPLAQLIAGVVKPLPQLLDAYRHGGGVAYRNYGVDMREGQAGINRTTFLQLLGREWLASIPSLHQRLSTAPEARVADFGCGCGWSAIGVALAYPQVRVDGFDSDPASIETARQNAADYSVADRVTFHCQDVSADTPSHHYDLVLMCEVLHDLGDPVGALRAAGGLLREGGTVLVVDERVGERFTAQGEDLEWMMYGWSILHCLPAGMADGAQHCCGGTGTVMRPGIINRYAAKAGFKNMTILPVENPFFRLYVLNT